MDRKELLTRATRALRSAFPGRAEAMLRALALKLPESSDRHLPPRTCFLCRAGSPPLVHPRDENGAAEGDPLCVACLRLASEALDAEPRMPSPPLEMLLAELGRAFGEDR